MTVVLTELVVAGLLIGLLLGVGAVPDPTSRVRALVFLARAGVRAGFDQGSG